MKTSKLVALLSIMLLCINGAFADGAKSLRLSEVSIGDSVHGCAWIEIQNISWGTQELGGFYITNDPAVFDSDLTPTQRMAKMHLIPTGNPITKIAPQNCILLYADGQDNLGLQHMDFTLMPGDIVAIYSGNGIGLIDSLTIPSNLKANKSFAIDFEKNSWAICNRPTPTQANDYAQAKKNNKVAEFKEKDPHGIAMAIMAMGTVFLCLTLLFVFFNIFGKVARSFNDKQTKSKPGLRPRQHSPNCEEIAAIIAVNQATSESGDNDLGVALIALSLESELAHDEESGVITIKPTESAWASKSMQIAESTLH